MAKLVAPNSARTYTQAARITTDVNAVLMERGILHATMLERLKQNEVNAVVSFLNNEVLPDLTKTVTSRLDRIRSRGFDRGPWTTKQYKEMTKTTQGMIRGGMREAGVRLKGQLNKVGIYEATFQTSLLQDAIPRGLLIDITTPSISTLKSIVTSKPFQGQYLSGWFNNLGDSLQKSVASQINIGLATGEPTQKIVSRLVGTARGAFKDGAYAVARRQAETVTRTAVNHVVTQAREATYKDNNGVVKGVRYLATLDSRTSDICASLDGQVFGIYEGPRPPMHHQCRSTTVPILKSWKELGINLKEAPASTRASMSGQVPATTTYGKWLKGQSKNVQNEVLGKGRASLFRRGKVPIERFVDNKFRPLTLKQLEALEQAKLKTGKFPRRTTTKKTVTKKTVTKKTVTKKVTTPLHEMTGKQLTQHMDKALAPQLKEVARLTSRVNAAEAAAATNHELRSVLKQGMVEQLNAETARTGVQWQGQELGRLFLKTPEFNKLGKRIQPLMDEINELNNLIATAKKELTARMHKMLEVPLQRRAQWVSEHTPFIASNARDVARKAALDEGQAWVARMYDKRVIRSELNPVYESPFSKTPSLPVKGQPLPPHRFKYVKDKGTRSSCEYDGSINITANAEAKTVVHELGHHVEMQYQQSRLSSTHFLKKRIQEAQGRGETVQRMKDLFPNHGYKADEIVWKDRFSQPYTGKLYYSQKWNQLDKITATEIMSVGTEEMFANPWKFLKSDREFFEFVVDNLRGKGTYGPGIDDLNPSIIPREGSPF